MTHSHEGQRRTPTPLSRGCDASISLCAPSPPPRPCRSQKLVPQTGGMPYMSGNNYVDLLVTLSPTEMISNFKAAAPPRVQEAVRRTVLRCIGSIRDSLVEDSHRCTGLIFAHLLYKAQVTGYMLFNAEVKVQGIVGTGLAASAPSLPPQQSHRPSEQAVPVEGEDEEGAKHLLEDGKSVRLGGALLGGEGETDAWLDGTVTVTTSVSAGGGVCGALFVGQAFSGQTQEMHCLCPV